MKRPGVPSVGVAYLRKVVQDGMVDKIQVMRPDTPTYDPVSGYATGVAKADLGYQGPAHIHSSAQSATMVVGDTMEPMAVIEISIPFDALPVPRNEDHVVVISVGAQGDTQLTGETLRIMNVTGGGIGFVNRTLTCTYEQANPFDTTA